MSTETHTEAGGLAAALKPHSLDTMSQDSGKHCECGSDSRFQQVNDPPWSSIHEHREHMALSWLTARLTDDDVAGAVAETIYDTPLYMGFGGNATEAERLARTTLAAAAAVIGGDRD